MPMNPRKVSELPLPATLRRALLAEAARIQAAPSRIVETAVREYLVGLRAARLRARSAAERKDAGGPP